MLLPRKSHGWRSLVGYSPWGPKELDMTELLQFHFLSFHSSNKINKRGDSIQPWHTALAYSVVPCLVLTVASWPAYRFLRRQVRWYGIPISLRIFQFVVIHTVKGFSIVSEAEVDVFLEFSCFFWDPVDVDNLLSGSSIWSQYPLSLSFSLIFSRSS